LYQYSFAKKLQRTIIREKLRKTPLYKKGVRKMLMKLTPGVDPTKLFFLCFFSWALS